MTTEELIQAPVTVYRIGKARTQHAWSVHVAGNDTTGYSVEVRTMCGVVLADDTAHLVEGFVTCDDCDPGQVTA